MALGRLLFPVIVAVFALFMAGYVVSHPGEPAPFQWKPAPCAKTDGANCGDRVVAEITGYYDDGKVFFSSQEERQAELMAHNGSIAPVWTENPIVFELEPSANDTVQGLLASFLGHHEGDQYTTPPLPPSLSYGDWEREVDVVRNFTLIPLDGRLDSGTLVGPGQAFNVSQEVANWASKGVTLAVGTLYPCEGPNLWQCKVVELNETANVLAYHREIAPHSKWPATSLLTGLRVPPGSRFDILAEPSGNASQVALVLDPAPGIRFQLVQRPLVVMGVGTYEVVGANNETFHARYSSSQAASYQLVGKTVYYDVVIVQVVPGRS